MSEYFLGQIMMVGFNYAPKNFAQCNGQLLPISRNQALFSLLGTQFGGNGTTHFALPDLRGRTPIGYANSVDPAWQPPGMSMGQIGGVENVALLQNNRPGHVHALNASTTPGDSRNPSTRAFATSTNTATAANLYAPSSGAPVTL